MYSGLLFLHFIGLALGVGTGFAFMRLGIVMKGLPEAERAPFFLRIGALARNGDTGLVLLIASGLGMTSLRGFAATFARGGPAFHAKLGLVLLFLGVLGYQHSLAKRVRVEQGGPAMAKIPKVGGVLLVLGLLIVGAAVTAFH